MTNQQLCQLTGNTLLPYQHLQAIYNIRNVQFFSCSQSCPSLEQLHVGPSKCGARIELEGVQLNEANGSRKSQYKSAV